jgi:OmcA/MtrC family decaheme c-type cytochrome
MGQFNTLFRWSWTFLVAVTLTLGLAGCEGDDGAAGAPGAAGTPGTPGTDGTDGTDGAAAVEAAKVESCATCHGDVGVGEHQSVYDKYVDASAFEFTFTNFTSTPNGVGGFDVSLEFSIAKNGVPFTDFNALPQRRFYASTYDSVNDQYLNGFTGLHENHPDTGDAVNVVMVADGDYVLTKAGLSFDPTVNGQVYGYIAQGELLEHAGDTGAELPAGTHVHLYDDVANTALAFGDASVTDPDAYVSAANVAGCRKCHGTPYLKHGFRDPIVDGLPDFASCKVCHNDDGDGGHEDWQYMVDEPFNWATAGRPEAEVEAMYAYKRNIMNDVHMSHAMEFPYPQSMSNCNTCHEGKLAQVLDNSNFTPETCKSCHPVQGIDTFPRTFNPDGSEILGGRGGDSPVPEDYWQAFRAPAFAWLWGPIGGSDTSDISSFHETAIVSTAPDACTLCHGAGVARAFNEMHTGYAANIYDATGTKYADLHTVSIEQITRSGDLLTVNFSSNNTAIVPEVLVSFYGWDSKQFIVASHTRDDSTLCSGRGCRMEYVPESSNGSANALFTEDAASVPGDWMVTLDMAAYTPSIDVLPDDIRSDDIPTLISNGTIKKVEVTITPELEIGGTDVVLKAVDATFDLGGNVLVANYFKGTDSTVEVTKCNVCHDSLASSFHDGSGRGGDGIEVCKNCHVTTSPGSHIEMASRAIDSYVHAIHSFQAFDVGDTFETFDPVLAKRYDQHVNHVFPNFTIRNCEACHRDGTYNVPDQSKSMPGLLAKSDDVVTWYMIDNVVGSPTRGLALEDPSGRNIGTLPELVTGPASRACGGCHRARNINDDLAGDLASFNAHTAAGGTLEENDTADEDGTPVDDEVVYGVIKKIMSMFE